MDGRKLLSSCLEEEEEKEEEKEEKMEEVEEEKEEKAVDHLTSIWQLSLETATKEEDSLGEN